MKLIKLNDLDNDTIYINSDRLVRVQLNLWVDEDSCLQDGSNVTYWNGERIVLLSVTERPEEIMEMVKE